MPMILIDGKLKACRREKRQSRANVTHTTQLGDGEKSIQAKQMLLLVRRHDAAAIWPMLWLSRRTPGVQQNE